MILRTVRLLLFVALAASLSLAAPPKAKKKKGPPPADVATEVALKKTLDGAEEKVGGCVLENAAPGPISLKVKAKLVLNSAGQLMSKDLLLSPEGPANEKTKACIAGVLDGLTWPRSAGPIVNAEREWSFEAK